MDCICGSTTGGLGLLGLWINDSNVHLVNQAVKSLTEYCQGPCKENQFAIINHESNGIDIVIALIINDIQPLSKNEPNLYYSVKNNASKLLLALIESNDECVTNAERILYNLKAKNLISVIQESFEFSKQLKNRSTLNDVSLSTSSILNLEESSLSCESNSFYTANASSSSDTILSNKITSYNNSIDRMQDFYLDENINKTDLPKEVAHNLYILAHKLAKFNKELNLLLKTSQNECEAFSYFKAHTAQIEVNNYLLLLQGGCGAPVI